MSIFRGEILKSATPGERESTDEAREVIEVNQ